MSLRRKTRSRCPGGHVLACGLLLSCLRSFAQADTIRLAWDPPAALPAMQPGETLWYQVSAQRTPATTATPLLSVPAPTRQVAITYPPLSTGERLCWSLTLQQRNKAWQMMAESPAALVQGSTTVREVCVSAPLPPPPTQELPRTGWGVSTDSSATGYAPRAAIDASLATFWHTPWQGTVPPYPHQLTILLPKATAVAGLRVTQRQDGNPGGVAKRWEVRIRDSANAWRTVASGTNTSETAPILVTFAPVTTTTVQWRPLDALDGRAWASAADVALLGPVPTPSAKPRTRRKD